MKSFNKTCSMVLVLLLTLFSFPTCSYADSPQPSLPVLSADCGQETTTSTVTLNVISSDAVYMQLSNDGVLYTTPSALDYTVTWDITDPAYGGTSDYGIKAIHCKVLNDTMLLSADNTLSINFIDPSTVVTFTDSNLESAIRSTLDIPTRLITKTDMLDLIYFNASSKGITDLEGLQFATNLKELTLKNNNISDISLLRHLVDLTYLELENNNISDITPLQYLTKLRSLHIAVNHITNIEPLQCLLNLNSLVLRGNDITNIEPLQPLVDITTLSLSQCQIADITPLQYLTNLRQLLLEVCGISNVEPLRNMVNLEYLYLLNNNITDIEPLTSLTKLVRLNLNGNPLSSTSKYTYIPILQGYDTDVSWTKSNTKQITSFSIPGQLSSQIIGANITVTMPLATDRSNLTPTIIHDGVSIDPASGAARNFTSPVTYTVTAEDGSQKVYTATVQYPNCNIFIDVHSSLIGTPNPYNTFYGYYQTDIEIVQDGTVLNTVTTDNMGFARVDNLPYGTYTVRLKNPADLTDNGTADVYTDYGNTKSANNTQVSFTLSSGTPAQYVTFVANVPPPLSVYGNVIYYTGTTDNPVITPIANAQITVDDTYTGNIDANGQFIINANHSINFVGAHKVQISTTASHSRIDIELNQIIKQDFSNTDTAQFNLTLSDVKINAISGGYSGQLVIFRVYDLHAPVVTPPQPTHDPDPVDTPSPLPEPSPTVVEEPTKELPASIITGTVKGRVTSVDGTPLSNIRIELHSDPRYTFTDNQGYYSFDNVDLGEHTISINDDKFQEKAKDLKDIKIVLELDKDNNVVVKSVQDSKDAFTDLSLDQDNRDKVINFVVVPKIPDTIKILPQTGDTINPLTVVLIIVIGVLGAVTLIDVIKKRKLKGLMK